MMQGVASRGLYPLGKILLHPAAKPLVFVLALCPLGWLIWQAAFDQLGANPAEALVRASGDWTLRMLCVLLAVTPLRVTLVLPALARFRRMLGLFVYFYASLHLLGYAWFDMGFAWADVLKDIARRPFILVGFMAFLVLTALALTSTTRIVKWLGVARWKRLHQGVFLVAGLAILHFFWMRAGKNNFAEVLVYAGVLTALLGWRLRRALGKTRRSA